MRGPWTVSRYLATEVVSYGTVGLVTVSVVFIAHNLLRRVNELLLIGVTASDILTVLGSIVLVTLAYTVPIAFLFGALIGMGRLASDSEMLALRTCGIGLREMVVPVLMIGAVVSLISGYIVFEQEHRAKRTLRDLLKSITASGRMIQPKTFTQVGKRMFYVESRGRDNSLEGVFIADQADPERPLFVFARTGQFDFDTETGVGRVMLRDGDIQRDSDGSEVGQRVSFRTFEYSFPVATGFLGRGLLRPRDMTLPELREAVATTRAGGSLNHLVKEKLEKYQSQIQRRYAVPFAPIVFALLAVPLGTIRMRGGRAWGALLSALVVGGYYGMVSFGEALVDVGVPAVVALWLPNLCFGAVGVLLLLRMRRVPS
ncbi:MAG: LptF/LptG family permease [Myxococcota bacterium]|jgi:lipopolysaccharide export system permease protein|nr:YjgP/YjgQ family permease [bacterium]MDP6075090.1 LptF/LptG family permease [Myxococcota bacterium]MDP7074800.1 LptF/LptG family permease [Myxococcota bacterium]MDP7298879.1 LptF/LptG family permease [Myxococcota bacterium]MDP7434044.1 LptF/LptG family permease [Myxococcota bacterium]